jgi:hypothetical protein
MSITSRTTISELVVTPRHLVGVVMGKQVENGRTFFRIKYQDEQEGYVILYSGFVTVLPSSLKGVKNGQFRERKFVTTITRNRFK